MGRKLRYLDVRVKGQPFIMQVSRVQYRDKKGRLSKFSPKKILKVEVIIKREVVDKKNARLVLREWVMKKHSLPYAKRKKPVTVDSVNKRIERKALKYKRSMLIFFEGDQVKFMYGDYKDKKGAKKKGVRKYKIKLNEYAKQQRKKKGSKNERVRTRKNSVQKH